VSRTLAVGDTVSGYRIESILGRGGMAVVYLAEHDRLKRKVALKVLSPEIAADETFRQRFVAESERLASVDHPNIIPIYEAGEDDELLFIAMRYVETTDLKQLIVDEGGLDPERAVSIVTQVAGALDAAHAKGLVHRDVKPANILVAVGAGADGGDHAYLSDFGLTKRTQETSGLTRTGFFMGTIDYIAPEQISGKGVDGRTDQYALACVLFECLSGSPPYQREDDAAVLFSHLSEPPPNVTSLRPELPPEIDVVISTGMAKEKEDRYPYCVALARAARHALMPRISTPPVGVAFPETVAAPSPVEPREAEQGEAEQGVAGAIPEAPPTETGRTPTLPTPPSPYEPPPPFEPPSQEPPSEPRRSRGPLVAAAIVVALLGAGIGAFALLSGDDGGGGTGTTAPTGATGVTDASGGTGPTAPTGASGEPFTPLSEADLLGTFSLTFSPEGDTSAGSATNATWEFASDCTERSGPHPCDADVVAPPVQGDLDRLGKTYQGDVTGALPCGDGDMHVEFEVFAAIVDENDVEDEGLVTEIRGQGTMLTGTCPGDVFTFVGTLA
jgi:serine/threonine protein kinase